MENITQIWSLISQYPIIGALIFVIYYKLDRVEQRLQKVIRLLENIDKHL